MVLAEAFQLKATVLWVSDTLVPVSQVLLFTGATKVALPGGGGGGYTGPPPPPPQLKITNGTKKEHKKS